MSSSVHVDKKGKDNLILREGPTQGLNHTLTAEAKILLTLYNQEKYLYQVYTIIKVSVFCLFMLKKIYLFKAKNSEIKDYTTCLGNVSKDFTINNMKFLLILILLIITILLISINT